jgi:hypothetical protein
VLLERVGDSKRPVWAGHRESTENQP